MLEDRIIVQDRGIDAGLAALIQNANKGNMDPAALMAMMNNNGMGGNGGWWWRIRSMLCVKINKLYNCLLLSKHKLQIQLIRYVLYPFPLT